MTKLRPLLVALLIIGILFFLVTTINFFGYRVLYQTTISMQRGFYLLTPNKNIHRSDIVAFNAPMKTTRFLLAKHWIPKSKIIIKQVYATPGDFACSMSNALWINKKRIAPIYHFYAPGKMLPQTHFCAKLGDGEYFLLSTKIARSFDSRYFGPIKKTHILGKVIPLWTFN